MHTALSLQCTLHAHLLAGTWAMAGLVPGALCLVLTPALMYVLYPPEVKDTPDAPAKVCCGQRFICSFGHQTLEVVCCSSKLGLCRFS